MSFGFRVVQSGACDSVDDEDDPSLDDSEVDDDCSEGSEDPEDSDELSVLELSGI